MGQNFSFRQAAVIGTGTMGRDVVMYLADVGLDAQWLDSSPQVLNQALDAVASTYTYSTCQERIGEKEVVARCTCIAPVQHLAAIRGADLMIGTVYENLELKQSIFHELGAALRSSAALTSDASCLDIDAIAAVTARPGQVLGLHFLNLAHIIRLLEIVRDAQTTPAVLEVALALGRRIGKISAVVDNCHGSTGNRMLESYTTGVHLMLLESALLYQVDRVLQAFGFTMGLSRMYDVVGIDLEWHARELAGVGQDQPTVQVDNRLCELSRFDQKNGAGYCRYMSGSHQAEYDTEADALVPQVTETLGYPRRGFAGEEALGRCLLALVNEDAKILDEGVAARSADIGTVYLNGCGFPVAEGGPMAWVSRLGAVELLQRLRFLEQHHGTCRGPASLVKCLAVEGGTFADLQGTR